MTIFFIWYFFSHFIFYFSPEKGDYDLSLSLSLSLSLYIYIYIYILFCNFTLGWWIIVFFILILGQYNLVVCLIFKFSVTSLLSPSFSFCLTFFFGQNTWLFWKWNFEFISKYNVDFVFECVYQLLKLNPQNEYV